MNDKKFYIVENGAKGGPYSIEDLKSKNVKAETLVWFDGLKEWKKIEEVHELNLIIEKEERNNRFLWILIILIPVFAYLISIPEDETPSIQPAIKPTKAGDIYLPPKDINPEKSPTYLEDVVQAVDFENHVTNDYAVKLASLFPGEYNIGQVCNIFDYIVKNWKYVNDSDKKENLRSASRSIQNNLAGDCDDFAILIAALVESIGGDTRISFAYNSNNKGHAFTEVYAADSEDDMQLIADLISVLYRDQFDIHYTIDKRGRCWLNMDWFGHPRHPGGEYYDYSNRIIFYPAVKRPYFEDE